MPMRRCCAAQRERVRERSAAQSFGRRAARLILARAHVLSCCRAYTHARTHSRTHARTDRRTCTHTQATHKHTSTNCAHSIRHTHARARARATAVRLRKCIHAYLKADAQLRTLCQQRTTVPRGMATALIRYTVRNAVLTVSCQSGQTCSVCHSSFGAASRVSACRSRRAPCHVAYSMQRTACMPRRIPRLTNACRTPIAVGHSGTRRAGCAQGVRRGAERYSNRTRSVVPAVVRGGRAKTGPGSSLKN